jgi:hypothetical protein
MLIGKPVRIFKGNSTGIKKLPALSDQRLLELLGDPHLSCRCLVFVRRLNRHFGDLRRSAPREALANRASRVVEACAKGRIDQTSTDLANGADGLLRTV